MARSVGLIAALTMVLAAVLVGCTAIPQGAVQPRVGMPRLDGLMLDESVTPAQLKATSHKFNCKAPGQSDRLQFCWPESADSQASVVMPLDGQVGGFMRTFNRGLEDAATKWAVSLMGEPTRHTSTVDHVDLMWDSRQAPYARLLTHLQQFDGQSAFLVMTRTLDRYLDEHDDLQDSSPEGSRNQRGMTPGRCLAIPFLCPAA